MMSFTERVIKEEFRWLDRCERKGMKIDNDYFRASLGRIYLTYKREQEKYSIISKFFNKLKCKKW